MAKSVCRILPIAAFVLAPMLAANFATAEYIPPENVSVQTVAYTPESTDFQPGTYKYSMCWQGIPVARGQIHVRPSGAGDSSFLKVTASAETVSAIDLFYSLDHKSESVFDARTLLPISFFSKQVENSRTKFRSIGFDGKGDISAKLWKQNKKGEEIPEEEHNFHSDHQTFDPISAAFLARSMPIEVGKKLSFDVFTGKHRFLISFEAQDREMIKIDGKKVEAFRVIPTVKKLTDTEGETKLQSATLWISTDEKRDLLKVESKVFVGRVTAELDGFVPDKTPDQGSLRASLSSQSPDTVK